MKTAKDLRQLNADDTTLMAEIKEKLKSLLIKVKKKKSGKSWFKTHYSKTKIMAFSPITL